MALSDLPSDLPAPAFAACVVIERRDRVVCLGCLERFERETMGLSDDDL